MSLLLFPVDVLAQEGMVPGFPIERDELALDRPAQPNTYFDKAGRKFAILGTESGAFEAWAYPLKLLRNFELSFLLKNSSRPVPARDIVRFIQVTPAATTITYAYQSFTVKATYIAAIEEPGAVILLAVEASEPLTVVAGFFPVLQPMWPAGIGGQYAYWDAKLRAYLISEPTRKNHGYVGSPAAQGISYTPAHMLSDTPNEFMIAIDEPQAIKGQFIPIILAGGKGRRENIRKAYENLASDPRAVYQAALSHYRDLKRNTLRVRTPVRRLDLALEWAKVSLDNLVVDNPDLGRGLVAGLGASGTGGRPGFGWFFGTDAYLNSMSLSSLGAPDAAKKALAFTQKWQREDGKMAHELSQAAGYIDWFKEYPYGYIHGDTTPYYIAAFYDYYSYSGDGEFLKQSWPSLRRAYEWCLTTDGNADGLMDNAKAGLGALEFGSLTGIETDIYLAAVWTRAAFGMAELARALGDEKLAARAAADHEKALKALEAKFWDAEAGQYSYAFSKDGNLVKELTPWCAVPLMWDIGNAERAAQTLEKMSSADLTTDWGIRILSSRSSLYEPLNYNYGAVWPFLGGYVAAAYYGTDNSLQAYGLTAANAGHFFDNALGHVTELFSGAIHVWPQEAVAHQGFSATGFVLPFVRGLLGLEAVVSENRVDFEPNFPADWSEVKVENFRIGQESVSLKYKRSESEVRLEIVSRPEASLNMRFAPSFGLGVRIRDVKLNGQPLQFEVLPPRALVRPVIKLSLSGQDVVEIKFDPTVEILPPKVESRVGDFDSGLKIIRQELDGKNLKLVVEGLAGQEYALGLVNAHLAEEARGGELADGRLLIRMPEGELRRFVRHEVIVRMK
jgi:glycogen debranching enzyme